MIDFRMDTLIAVCKHMNYTKAAKELNLTQPAVSQHIKYLEDKYQIKIFEFIGKKITLTNQGKILLDAATTLKHDNLFLFERLHDENTNITFGVTLSVGEYMIKEPLKRIISLYPKANIKMIVDNTTNLIQGINTGKIDFAIVEGYFEKREFDSLVYSNERYIGVSSFDNPLQVSNVEELFKNTLISREEGSGTREILERFLKERNYLLSDFSKIIEVGNISTIKQLVKDDLGISFLYQKAVQDELDNHKLKEIVIDGIEIHHDITFLWRKDSIFSNNYQDLFHLIKDDNN